MQRLPDRSLLYPVLDAAIRVDSAVAGHIQEHVKERRELRIIAHRGFDAAYLEHFGVARPGDGSAGGQILTDRRRIHIRDTHTDPAYAPHVPFADAAGCRSILALPLMALAGALVGAMSTHHAQPSHPSQASLKRLEQLARIAAQILACALLRDQVELAGRPPAASPTLSVRAVHAALLSRELLVGIAERADQAELIGTAVAQLDRLLDELGPIVRRERLSG